MVCFESVIIESPVFDSVLIRACSVLAHFAGLLICIDKKHFTSFKLYNATNMIDPDEKSAIIDPMDILNSEHLELTRFAFKAKRKTDLAKIIGASTSTIDALFGVIDRPVTLDKRLKIRETIDAQLKSIGWELIQSGGIRRIKKPEDAKQVASE